MVMLFIIQLIFIIYYDWFHLFGIAFSCCCSTKYFVPGFWFCCNPNIIQHFSVVLLVVLPLHDQINFINQIYTVTHNFGPQWFHIMEADRFLHTTRVSLKECRSWPFHTEFCWHVQKLCGERRLVPNMHFTVIFECVQDRCPIHGCSLTMEILLGSRITTSNWPTAVMHFERDEELLKFFYLLPSQLT